MSKANPSNTIDFNQARLEHAYTSFIKRLEQPEDLYSKLTSRLQTTLDVKQLLNIFFSELVSIVDIDSITFTAEGSDERIRIGQGGPHSCNYTIRHRADVLGVLSFKRGKRFIEAELTTIEKLMRAMVYPLRNALAYERAVSAAYTDPLTGIGNRHALDFNLRREADIAQRHNQDFSIIIFDLDFFKRINDTYGHSAGDEVLKQTIAKVKDCLRASDICFRYGGEEFLILMNNTDTDGALILAERIRQSVAATPALFNNQEIHVSVSLGVATLAPEETLNGFIDRADAALYKAKQEGRNRSAIAQTGAQAQA